jgi:hypothetical protein
VHLRYLLEGDTSVEIDHVGLAELNGESETVDTVAFAVPQYNRKKHAL